MDTENCILEELHAICIEESSEGQGPPEHAAVQHADTAKECQAEREGSFASLEEVSEVVWSEAEVGPEVTAEAS